MAPLRNPSPSANGAGRSNLFVEADPELEPVGSPRATRRRGLVVPVDSPSPTMAARTREPDVARFTRPRTRLGRLQAIAGENLRRVDANAGGLLRGLTARPYAALSAIAALGAVLLALSWLGLALRDSASGRRAANRRAAVAATALTQARARIDTLSTQLEQATLAAKRPPAATAANTSPPVNRNSSARAGRKPPGANRGRH